MSIDDPRYKPTTGGPMRLMVMGSSEPAWYQTSLEDQKLIIPAMQECFATWIQWGAKLLTTFDDDFLMAGTPRERNHSFYMIYEVESLELASAMINLMRQPLKNDVVLHHYFRVDAKLGRDFYPAEQDA